MSRIALLLGAAACSLALGSLLSAWVDTIAATPSRAAEALTTGEVEQLLRGHWEREDGQDGTRVHRLLALEADQRFSEQVRITEPSGRVHEQRHEGTWLYDGTNLKRRYTLMDGQPPSRLRVPVLALEVRLRSDNAFTGIDRVRGREVEYRRVR